MAEVPAGDTVRRAVGRRDPERVARPRYLPGAGLPARPAGRGPGFPLPAGGRLQQQRADPPPPGIPAHRHDNPLRLDPVRLAVRRRVWLRGSAPGREFLEGPAVAVGVGKEHELAPRLHVDVAGLDPPFHELLAGGLDVANHNLDALL